MAIYAYTMRESESSCTDGQRIGTKPCQSDFVWYHLAVPAVPPGKRWIAPSRLSHSAFPKKLRRPRAFSDTYRQQAAQ
jgi:hypothetical protein